MMASRYTNISLGSLELLDIKTEKVMGQNQKELK